jgi:amidase
MPHTNDAPARVHAFTADALGDHDAVGLAAELRAGRVSSKELVDAAIARVEVLDPVLHAVASERYDAARAQAVRPPGDGFLAGLPTFVKDNSDLAGLPTQQGTTSYVGRPKDANGDLAAHFTGLGLLPLGKTRLSEFGFSASAEFVDAEPVRNAWLPGHTSGASSAGSSVLVAGGAVPLAHANDGGGSIRIPAACNGLVGLKPSRGRVPQDRTTREMPVRIVADGVVTRSVRDTAAFLRESERRHRNLKLPPIGDVTGPGHRRLRVALVEDSINRPTDVETRAVVRRTAQLLEALGHEVVPTEAPVPASFEDDFLLYWGSFALFLTRTGRRTLDPSFDAARTDNLTRGLARHSWRRAWRLPAAMARLQASQRTSRRFHESYDVTLTPTTAMVTPELGWLSPAEPFETIIDRLMDWVTFTPWQNATGDPAISLPMGTSERGLPIGVMLSSAQGHERRLLEVAYELEAAQPFARIQG